MNEKIPVKICTGTLCYVMGGAELQLLEEYLPADLLERVEIVGTSCLDCCNRDESQKAPFVQVGDTIVANASLTKVAEAIRIQLESV